MRCAVWTGGRDFRIEERPLPEPGPGQVRVRVHAEAEGQPLLYAHTWGRGRVHYNALGHDRRALGHPSYQRLLAQAVAWALGAS